MIRAVQLVVFVKTFTSTRGVRGVLLIDSGASVSCFTWAPYFSTDGDSGMAPTFELGDFGDIAVDSIIGGDVVSRREIGPVGACLRKGKREKVPPLCWLWLSSSSITGVM